MTDQTDLKVGGYELDIVIQGYPGKSVCHGGLGWSTVVLVKHGDRLAMIDAGSFGMRRTLIERLKKRGLTPRSVTDLLLTHSHHDHAVNWTLFRDARIVIGRQELAWALTVPWGLTPVPEIYMKELNTWPTLAQVADGEEVFPGITAHVAPGHTPGSLLYVLHGADRDVIFTGDAAKNRAEILSGEADASYDHAATRASIDLVNRLWRARPGNIVVPGHDMPIVLDGAETRYLGKREAAIYAWYGDDMEETKTFELTVA
jgi:glyoxylase-like metal-dependent hydrolase (beta-lactamase superfamily II)